MTNLNSFKSLLLIFVIANTLVVAPEQAQANFLNLEDEESEDKSSRDNSNDKKKKRFKHGLEITYLRSSYQYQMKDDNSGDIDFNTSLNSIRLDFKKYIGRKHKINFLLSYGQYEFSNLGSGISPSSIDIVETKLEMVYSYLQHSKQFKKYRWHFQSALRIDDRQVSTTNPVQITDMSSKSIGFGVSKLYLRTKKLDFGGGMRIYPVKFLSEGSDKTGDLQYALDYKLYGLSTYAFDLKSRIKFSYEFQSITNWFSGSGNRQTPSAQVEHTTHSIGIGLEYEW
jgi:hypothetical protein